MNKAIFKQANTYIALTNLFLGLFFIFQEEKLAKFAGFVWLLSFIFNLFIANRMANKQ
ncbi:MAG: hypothetical protein RR548_06410 [Carnobacterium sp.]|uniref:hypothetical protein n=1 Tax=Carnobacterium sp. TaxID=48221 RepID=UPI002FCAB3D2